MRDKSYYDQFNSCENIKNSFDYLTVPQAALIWCGVPRDEISIELKQCHPKGSTNAQLRNTFVHPYITCVEPRCTVLHEAFNKGQLRMGRDGGNSDYIYGEKDKHEYDNNGISGTGHINPERRTIKINDLKDFIREYYPDDMPKTLFSPIDISKAVPITHEDYLTLKSRNEALESRIEKAKEVYKEQKNCIAELEDRLRQVQTSQLPKINEKLSERTEISYLTTIGLLLELMTTPKGLDNRAPFQSQNTIISDITDKGIYGQGKSTLETRFSEANRILESGKKQH